MLKRVWSAGVVEDFGGNDEVGVSLGCKNFVSASSVDL